MQCKCECAYCLLARSVVLVRADLREELPVDVRLLVAFCFSHSAFLDESQKHFREAFVEVEFELSVLFLYRFIESLENCLI